MKKTVLFGTTTLAVALTATFTVTQAQAQSLLPETVVTATRIPVPAEQFGGAVSVIDEATINRKQRRTLSDALLDVPGARVVQLGGPGHQSSLFVRGANSNHVLVLLDGIELGDPSAPAGAYDFGNFFLGDLGRIEVLRGAPASTYGSEAIGGVVNMVSAPVLDDTAELRIDGGSFGTFNQSARVTRLGDTWELAGSLSHAKSGGESLTAQRFRPANGDDEEDGHENFSGSLRLGWQASDVLEVQFVGHAFQTEAELDPTAEDPDSNSDNQQYYARLQSKTLHYDGRLEQTTGLNVTHVKRDFYNAPDSLANTFQINQSTGRRIKADWRNDLFFLQDHQVSIGLEYEHEKYENTQFSNFSGFVISGSSSETAATRTVYIQDTVQFGQQAFVTADVRYDDTVRFKGKATYRLSPVVNLQAHGLRLRGAYGTGFRVPALFELFGSTSTSSGSSFQGNRNLKPEESTNWEVGFDKSLLGGRAELGLTYFENRIENLIVSSGTPTIPNNVREADINGVEAVLSLSFSPSIDFAAAYTFTSSENAATGQVLQRRPKHKIDLDLQWQATSEISVTALLGYIGETRDAGFNGGTVYRGGYTVTDLRGDWRLREDVTAFARVDNVFDTDFEVADGFRGRSRGIFVGASVRF